MEELMDELKAKLRSLGIKILISLAVIAAIGAVLWQTMGFVAVGPQSVKVIKARTEEAGISIITSRALVNEQINKSKRFPRGFPWPGKKTGYVEEEYSIAKPFNFEEKMGLQLKYQKTGKNEDKKTVEAYVVSGTFKVKDWDAFARGFNPDAFNAEQFDKGGIIKANRMEILGNEINAKLQEIYRDRMDWLLEEFTADRNLAIAVAEKEKIGTPEKLAEFISQNMAWYAVLGARGFNNKVNSAATSLQVAESPFLESDVSQEALDRMFLSQNEIFLRLQNRVVLMTREYEEKIAADSLNDGEWSDIYEKQLLPFYLYLNQQIQGYQPEFYELNFVIWSAAFQTAFMEREESIDYFQKTLTPLILRGYLSAVFTNLPLELISLEVNLEERPLFTEDGMVDRDFQWIFQYNQELFQ